MARIAGINVPDNKKVSYSITAIFGIGINFANNIIKKANIDPNKRMKELTEDEIEKIRQIINKDYQVEGDLKMMVSGNIKRLKEINTYRGVRHLKNLPTRGQRTKTNARTKRGKKITMGSGRKQANLKT